MFMSSTKMDVTVNLFTFLCYFLFITVLKVLEHILLQWKSLHVCVTLPFSCLLRLALGLSPVFPEKHFFFNFSPERV